MPARRLSSWAWTTALTVGAVAAVAVLAVQADHGTKPVAAARPSASASAHPRPTPSAPPAVPGDSGTGRRVVYSLGQHRLWLVDAGDVPRRTFPVWAGTVSPDPGKYTVSVRRETTTGSDGVPIEHIVYFAAKSGVSIAFSNAVDGSSPPPPAAGSRTGGIRMRAADGAALWTFATPGTTVAVVS